jgi:predicted transcriptional regulator
MRRTTIKLPDDVDLRLRYEARRRGTTISDVTRQAIVEHLAGARPSLLAAGAGRSGRRDVSDRIEEILRKELA